jgi:dihydropteroate synthase
METARLPAPALATTPISPSWSLQLPRGRTLRLGARSRIVGILNLTPDSFSDGGLWQEPRRAVARGLEMLAQGAELLDLGAESTRPGGGVYGAGARPVDAAEELARLLPVLEPLRQATTAPISVDTRKGEVARRALAAGADLINDVSALADRELATAVAEAGCPLVLMHSRGEIPTMQRDISFRDVVGEVRAELAEAVGRAVSAGIDRGQLIVDPGIGFGKTAEQNLVLIRRLAELTNLGRPLLVGASRKSFLARAVEQAGRLAGAGGETAATAGARGAMTAMGATGARGARGAMTAMAAMVADMAQPSGRLPGSLASLAWAAAAGVALVRVHDVAETAQFLSVWEAIAEAQA